MVIFIAFCLAVSLHILAAFKDAIDNPYARQNHPKLGMGNVNLTLLEHEKRLAIREFERVQPLIHSMRNVGKKSINSIVYDYIYNYFIDRLVHLWILPYICVAAILERGHR